EGRCKDFLAELTDRRELETHFAIASAVTGSGVFIDLEMEAATEKQFRFSQMSGEFLIQCVKRVILVEAAVRDCRHFRDESNGIIRRAKQNVRRALTLGAG